MDAEPIDSWGNEAIKIQLEMPLITRELNKLLIGFTSCPDGMPIATGKWGCGAFGGHAVIKVSLIGMKICSPSYN